MQHSGLRQFSRTILTVVGILLLIIFGTRAASQASSLTAVGGRPKPSSFPVALPASRFAEAVTDARANEYAVSYKLTGFETQTVPVSEDATASGDDVQSVKAVSARVEGDATQAVSKTQAAVSDSVTQGLAAGKQRN